MGKRVADVPVDSPSTAALDYLDDVVAEHPVIVEEPADEAITTTIVSPGAVTELEKAYSAPPFVRTSPITGGVNMGDLEQAIDNILQARLSHFISDIERRYTMALDLEQSGGRRQIGAAEINDTQHRIEGYTVTSNSPASGRIAWTNVHIVYNGVDYTCADGNTSTAANRYVWFVKPASYTAGTPVTLSQGTTQPTLANGDCMVFVNNSGVATSALERSGSSAVLDPNSVNTAAIGAGQVTDTEILGVGASKVSGVLGTGNIPTLDAAKIGSGTFTTTQIPNLDAAKVTSGTFGTGLIPSLPASKITSGTFADAQIPTLDAAKIGSGTFTTGQIPTLDAAKIGSGSFGATRLNINTHIIV